MQRNRTPLFVAVFAVPMVLTGEQPGTPAQTLKEERIICAQSFVSQQLSIWQKRLQLEDWNVSFRLVRIFELKPKTLGHIHWDSDLKKAEMSVLSPADYKISFPDALKDMEATVVHELIHLRFATLLHNQANRSAEEKAVNKLTEALLNADLRQRAQPCVDIPSHVAAHTHYCSEPRGLAPNDDVSRKSWSLGPTK